MSNKDHERKMDGVFDTSGEKTAVKPDKPARPPKSKPSLTRETKVGLAVIGALLIIFVIVLVVRFRGGSGEEATETQTTAKNSGENLKKSIPKATAPESRTLIASQSGGTGQWPGASGSKTSGSGGFGASKPGNGSVGASSLGKATVGSVAHPSGSAYGDTAYSDNDQLTHPKTGATYLPSNTPRGSAFGGASELQAHGDVKQDADSALRLNPSDLQKPAGGIANPFSVQPRMEVESASASVADEAVASDEADPKDPVERKSDTATADSIGSRRTGQPVNGLGATPPPRGLEQHKDLQPQETTAPAFANARAKSPPNEPDLGEAKRFVPNPFGSNAGGDRLVGNHAQSNSVDSADEPVNAGRTGVPSKLTSVKGLELSERQATATNTEGDLAIDSALPFRKSPSADAPAPLDETVLEGTGVTPEPIRREASAPREAAYAVAAGDTYWTIAKEKYGSGAYFKALYEHNRRQMNHTGSLRPGMQLKVPDEATLQRLYPSLCPRPERVAAAMRATRASATMPADGREYVVSDGDTLYDVARRQLGKASRWAEIYELNRDSIGAASDRLEPGTRLALPANN